MRPERPRCLRPPLILAIAVALLAGCGALPIGWGPFEPGLAPKEVAGKREPNELVAADRTRCSVDRERFASVEIGERVWCLWLSDEGFPGRR